MSRKKYTPNQPGQYTIEIVRSKRFMAQRYHARIVHTNGKILWSSEKQYNIASLENTCRNFAMSTGISTTFRYVGYNKKY